MTEIRDLLKGMPVYVMRAGCYPNKADILDIMARYPGATVRTEVIHHPVTRFTVTVRLH
jgi:hypothetical protein